MNLQKQIKQKIVDNVYFSPSRIKFIFYNTSEKRANMLTLKRRKW